MKSLLTISMMMLAFTMPGLSQPKATIIKTEALKMARALAAMDLEAYTAYSWPALVSDPAAKELIKSGADSADKYRKQYGIKVKSIIIGNPSPVVRYKGVWQCTLPQQLAVEALMGSIETETTLVGLSTDGSKWYFVDAMLYSRKDAASKLPELSPQLVIPPAKPPVLKDAQGKEIKRQ